MQVVEDPVQLSRVLSISEKLSQVSRKRKGIGYNFSLLKDVNAYSGYAGFIYVGLPFLELFNDDELAFIIAHEMAHADNRDTANSIEKEASKKFKDQDKKISITDELLVGYHYDRIQEYRADSQAVLYMYLAGYNVNAAITVMEKFQSSFGAYSPGMEKVSDHPSNISRKRNIESFIKELNYVNKYILNDANLALESGMYDDAIKFYSNYLTFFYNSYVGYYKRGISYLNKGLNNSESNFLWATNEDTVYFANKNHKNNPSLIMSSNDFKTANKLKENDINIINYLAIVNIELGSYLDAEKGLRKAMKINPNSCETLNNLGLLSMKQKKLKQSLEYFEKAITKCSSNPVVNYNLATLYKMSGDNIKSKYYYQASLKYTNANNIKLKKIIEIEL